MRQAVKGARSKKALAEYKTPVTRKVQPFEFDYWGWWKRAVKVHNISPPYAWGLEYSELQALEDTQAQHQDISFMLAFIRKQNGAPPEITQGLF